MKKLLLFTLLTCLATTMGGYGTARADWLTDYVEKSRDSTGRIGPSVDQSDGRTTISGGSFTLREKREVIYPVTITPPSLSLGCGGMDIAGGSVEILDEIDSYITALKTIMQSEAFYLDLGINAFCPACADGMKAFKAEMAKLNSIAINQCQMQENLKSFALGPRKEGEAEQQIISAEMSGKVTNFVEGVNRVMNGDILVDRAEQVKGCGAKVEAVFSEGSLAEHVLNMTMSDPSGANYVARFVGGLAGEIRISTPATGNTYTLLPPCGGSTDSALVDLVWTGKYQYRDDAGVCKTGETTPLYKMSLDNVKIIATAIKNRTDIPPSAVGFMETVQNLPVYQMVKASIWVDGETQINIGNDKAIGLNHILAEAAAYSYAGAIINNLTGSYRNAMTQALGEANDSKNLPNCDIRMGSSDESNIRSVIGNATLLGEQAWSVAGARVNQIRMSQDMSLMYQRMNTAASILNEQQFGTTVGEKNGGPYVSK